MATPNLCRLNLDGEFFFGTTIWGKSEIVCGNVVSTSKVHFFSTINTCIVHVTFSLPHTNVRKLYYNSIISGIELLARRIWRSVAPANMPSTSGWWWILFWLLRKDQNTARTYFSHIENSSFPLPEIVHGIFPSWPTVQKQNVLWRRWNISDTDLSMSC